MQALEGLLWSLVFLIIAAGAMARIVGWRELEGLASRAGVAVVLVLFCLPLARHEARAVRDGIASRLSTGHGTPQVVVVGAGEIAGVTLVVAGHIAMGIWLLRRRARGEDQRRDQQQREADRRRDRTRLPPRDLGGGAP
jgi:hypothetical protein